MNTRPELKQYGDLRLEDFLRHPVWVACHTVDYDEEWHDDTDEETFRPWTGALPVGADEMYLVLSSFTLRDGTVMSVALPRQQAKKRPGVLYSRRFFCRAENCQAFGLGCSHRREHFLIFAPVLGKRRKIFFLSDFPHVMALRARYAQARFPA
jgi:hypothetical protein